MLSKHKIHFREKKEKKELAVNLLLFIYVHTILYHMERKHLQFLQEPRLGDLGHSSVARQSRYILLLLTIFIIIVTTSLGIWATRPIYWLPSRVRLRLCLNFPRARMTLSPVVLSDQLAQRFSPLLVPNWQSERPFT
jgi:hypothetical protein